MSQTNSNNSHVDSNSSSKILESGNVSNPSSAGAFPGFGSSNVSTSTSGITTVLGNVISRNSSGMDSATQNGNYEVAHALANGTFSDGTQATAANGTQLFKMVDGKAVVSAGNTAALLANNVANVNFLPTEQVAKAEWGAANTTASYLNGANWTAAPKFVGTPSASAFTLSNNNDGGKTVVYSEAISGSPFTTANGSYTEALTFRSTANNDVLSIKHNVAVANVPAVTNNNNANALDVRNESYAENYAKAGVSSNYARTSAHKYAEVNGNQTLNDAFAETYAYRDDKLTISSAVKTAVADAAHINGAERIVESRAANYSYEHKDTGSVKYVVTDTRDLAQVDQRTWTNTTVTNVAKFDVVDKTNGTTITAKGLVTGTTTNISSAQKAGDETPTKFTATGAEFKVDSAHYSLVVDPKEFNIDHAGVNANALLTLVNDTSFAPTMNMAAMGGDVFNSALGDVPAGSISMADAFNPYVDATANTLVGTRFNDVITIKDVPGVAAGTFVGGNVNAGAGNDTVTGSKGDDVIDGGAGNDTITVSAGADVIVGFEAAIPAVVANPALNIAAQDEIIRDVLTVAPGLTIKISEKSALDPLSIYKFYTLTAGAEGLTIKSFDDWSALVNTEAAQLAATFDYSYSSTGLLINDPTTRGASLVGSRGNDTINGLAGNDTIFGNTGSDVLDGGDGNDLVDGGAGNDTVYGGDKGADTLTGGTGADVFKFTEARFTAATTTQRQDTITDFSSTQGDKIDLSAIDADIVTAADQAFAFVTTADFTAAGQLRYNATTSTLEANTDANFATVEFSVKLTGVTAVAATDFVL